MTRLHRLLLQEMTETIKRYEMFRPGDRVLVAMSGGKDSFVLWRLLKDCRSNWPDVQFLPVHVEAGFGPAGNTTVQRIATYLKQFGEELHIISRNYGQEILQMKPKDNPCFRCSRLRRKALFETAAEFGCRKVALAHHRDDVIETLLLNILFGREISTMLPVQPLFDGQFYIVRPLWATDEKRIQIFAREQAFPTSHPPCPFAGYTRRQHIKQLLDKLEQENPHVRESVFQSLFHVNNDFLPGTLRKTPPADR